MKAGTLVKLNKEATFDKLVLMGIKPEVAEYMIHQSRFEVEKEGNIFTVIKVKTRSIQVFNKYIEKV